MTAELHSIFVKSKGVNTDTRSLLKDEFYVALKGDNFDGNKFVQQALDQGAFHVLSSDRTFLNNERVTVVPDTLVTLQELATYHRKQLNCSIVALTGSNGKTTTKELILAVLQTHYTVCGTHGNLNNHIGVPLTLLSFNKETEIGIVEMGANHQKEIAFLCSIALPDYGLITNYGKAHLEGFGGVEGVIKGKSEMYDYLRVSKGTAIVGRWDALQLEKTSDLDRIMTIENQSLETVDPFIKSQIEGVTINSNLTGSYNYNNILFAASIGRLFNVSIENIKKGVESYTPANNRSQIIVIENCTIILDAYNANPSSMEVALINLSKQKQKNKIVVLGDMFELGEYSQQEHQQIADLSQSLHLDQVYLVGDAFYETKSSAMVFQSFERFVASFSLDVTIESACLIKGSRGMKLERLMDFINKK
jgi:UDP-N-acetylmuramoyl-tripeptide--D-alanyl-D-alanine ligase